MIRTLLSLLMINACPLDSYPAKFVGCYDGDTCTFDLTVSDRTTYAGLGIKEQSVITRVSQSVRLCDINAPEMKPGPNPNAIKARDDLVSWISNANEIIIEVPTKPACQTGEHDEVVCEQFEKYGRLLGWVIADGVNLNKKQLDTGNAVAFIPCK